MPTVFLIRWCVTFFLINENMHADMILLVVLWYMFVLGVALVVVAYLVLLRGRFLERLDALTLHECIPRILFKAIAGLTYVIKIFPLPMYDCWPNSLQMTYSRHV